MALSEEEQKTLDNLTKKAQESEDDYDVEIWDETGAGARVPYSKGKSFLARFGIDVEEPSEEESSPAPKDKDRNPKPGNSPQRQGTPQRYFGKRTAR